MPPRCSKGTLAYGALVLLRVFCALSPGYIHPDEWFQYGEVLMGDFAGIDGVRTWEFDPAYPCRSMASIRLFGLPSIVLAKLCPSSACPSSFSFLAQRLTFLLLSFAIDWSTLSIMRFHPSHMRQKALLLVASSASLLCFGVRPFSNNCESCIVALCLALERSTQRKDQPLHRKNAKERGLTSHSSTKSALFGAMIAIGVFSRFTTSIFVAPICLSFLLSQIPSWKKNRLSVVHRLASLACGFLLVSIVHIAYDTYYYSPSGLTFTLDSLPHLWSLRSRLVIAPVNAALYNSSKSNLAQHGLHPRWLHAVVNAPMVLGLVPWFTALLAISKSLMRSGNGSEGRSRDLEWSVTSIIIFSILVLSTQPHQEPRFLVPLMTPVAILTALSGDKRQNKRGWQLPKTLIVALQACLTVVFFNYLHQAGLTSAMLEYNAVLRTDISSAGISSPTLYFWRTFMPPRHLIMPMSTDGESTAIAMHDIGSLAEHKVADTLLAELGRDGHAMLFAPLWAVSKGQQELQNVDVSVESVQRTFTPHLDMDHLAESLDVWRSGKGSFWQGFSFGVWQIRPGLDAEITDRTAK